MSTRRFVSEVSADGRLKLSLRAGRLPQPGPGEVLIRIEAAPVNPADIKLMLAGVAPGTMAAGDRGSLVGPLPANILPVLAGRIGKPLPIGNEGCGTVVALGEGLEPGEWIGRRVAVASGGMFADHATASAADCIVLPDGVSAARGAAAWINPMTALAMVETMRREGYSSIVLTAAASSLGHMLNRLCLAEGIALVNIVRSSERAQLLRSLGARHVCDTSEDDFDARLEEALAQTGATLAFDATGGGNLAGRILKAMDTALARDSVYSRYGSTTCKQLYFFGGLDSAPVQFERNFGMAWGMGGWLLQPRLASFGQHVVDGFKARIAREVNSTFRTEFGMWLPLPGLLDPRNLAAMSAMTTSGKVLVLPSEDQASAG